MKEEKLQEFSKNNNKGEIDYNDANTLINKARNAQTKAQALKYAKEAHKKYPNFLDAAYIHACCESNPLKKEKILNEGLKVEKERLEAEGYFSEDNIGYFYSTYETVPYLRALNAKVSYCLYDGKIKIAQDTCEEMIRLDEIDHIGARYTLMAIYAYFENEEDMLKLYHKYPDESLRMLYPLFALYYKLENDKKAKEYLARINKINPHFLKFFNNTIQLNQYLPDGYFTIGDSSEVIAYFQKYDFLLQTTPIIDYYVKKYSKIQK